MAKSWSASPECADGPGQGLAGRRRVGPAEELVVVPELVGEREDAEVLVGPADEAAVDVVQVAVDHQAPVERDASVARRGRSPRRPARRPAGTAACREGCPGPRRIIPAALWNAWTPATLGWSRRNSATARVSGQQSGIVARAGLDVVGLPVGGPVPVHVVAAGRVFVDLRRRRRCRSPPGRAARTRPPRPGLTGTSRRGIVGRDLEPAVRVLPAHLGDLAVAVEVVVAVLVGQRRRGRRRSGLLPPRELFVVFGPLNQ